MERKASDESFKLHSIVGPVVTVVTAMYKLKILVVGPCRAGKTVVSNFLADATENTGGEYRPTAGCRILEFESQSLNVNNKVAKADVEVGT